jgi:tetratricopeptide (TPR) repeat protein
LNNEHANSNDSKKALVIAVSEYDNSSGLKSIEFCKNDGKEMYDILKKNGYDIPDSRKLIGYVDSQRLKETIYGFFTDEDNKPDDTLVFYYSGHGVPDKWAKTFLAPSDMNSDHPRMTGFSFDDLTDSMLECNSLRVVTILDSCFSGSLKISKGLDSKSGEEAATRIANSNIEEKSNKLQQGRGRCLLAASQGYEEAYDRQEKDHSVFTYYLLEGLKGHKNAIDDEGNVTYDTLGNFITREIGNLPPEKRPKQTPVRKGEVAGGEIILANYPELRKSKESDYFTLFGKGENYYRRGKYQEALECFDSILKLQPKDEYALLRKGNILVKINEDKKALEYFDQIIKLNKNNFDAWYYKAQLNIKIKDYEHALQCLDKASNINPNDERVWEAFKRVKSLTKAYGQKEEQEIILPSQDETSKTIVYDDIASLNDKGNALYNQGKYQESVEIYDKVLKIDSNNEFARYNRFLVLEHLAKEKHPEQQVLKDFPLPLNEPTLTSQNSKSPTYILDKKWVIEDLEERGWVESIAIDSKHNVYVIISVNLTTRKFLRERYPFYAYVYRFDNNGNFITKWIFDSLDNRTQGRYPSGIAVDSAGYVYVADSDHDCIHKFDNNGSFITKWGLKGKKDQKFNLPIFITVDLLGFVYVADNKRNQVQKFYNNGSFITKWGSEGINDGQFHHATSIAADSAGYVYVSDGGNHRVQKFDSDGNFLLTWGSKGTGDGQFNIASKLAVDSVGYVYVIDHNNNRVQKFNSDGEFITKLRFEFEGGIEINMSERIDIVPINMPSHIAIDSNYIYMDGHDASWLPSILKFRNS